MVTARPQVIRQKFNRLYKAVFTTDARYIDIWGGRGRGGSHFGTDYFLHLITKPHYFRGYFLRQAFNDIRDSLFQDFKDRIEENETVNLDDFLIVDTTMRITYKPTGNMIISKGVKKDGSRTAKLKSLAGATHILGEEFDEIGEEDFDTLDLSLRKKGTKIQILRCYNPPHKQHWIWRDYNLIDAEKPADYKEERFPYYKAVPKQDVSLCSIFSTYHDNFENLNQSAINKFESFKPKKPEYYYTTIGGLIGEGMRGRIFSGWQSITDEEFEAVDALPVVGQDYGSATGGIVEVKIVNNRVYIRELSYGGMTDKEIGVKLCVLKVDKDVMIGDSAEPQTIGRLRKGWTLEELSDREREDWTDEGGQFKYPALLSGFNIYGVVKKPGYRAWARKTLMDYEVFATEGSSNLWNEYREHKWALDKNKNPTDEPEDGNDHLIDPTLYVLTSKGRFF